MGVFRFSLTLGETNIKLKWKKKSSQQIKNGKPTFWEIMLILTLKRQDFVQIFLFLENYAKYCLDPDPEQKLKLFQTEQIIMVPQH
jgi:hypothetical protein